MTLGAFHPQKALVPAQEFFKRAFIHIDFKRCGLRIFKSFLLTCANMSTNEPVLICKSCGVASSGKYCHNCGQGMAIKRLSLHSLLHEAFHFFTHVDKGLFYTLKMLLLAPGKMQREYINGDRVRYQKPFSMFFVSATASGLIYYWVNNALLKLYHSGTTTETYFFNHYWVLLQVCLLPLYSLIVYLCFKKAGYNYGEIAVYQLYNFSILFLIVALIQLSKFINHDLNTRYIEFPLIVGYMLITNLNFFTQWKRSTVILIGLISISLVFGLAAFVQDRIIDMMQSTEH